MRSILEKFSNNLNISDHAPLKILCVKLRTIGTFLLFEPCGARRVQKCGVIVQVETQDQNFSRGHFFAYFLCASKESKQNGKNIVLSKIKPYKTSSFNF
ncbi:hypothetical protein A6A20_02385 [Volucribacter amazonae]|uniref:Uncharacterized protein n=1 Tax=Volucribacter amazonae TaxID=256731 RepID=A0A9X4P8L6_9PAST|nr:hypothetical protein [Volucribacter amazonae]